MSFPVRHTPRAKWHKYNGAEYFVTICTASREHYFGEVREGQTQLTAVGECLRQEIEKTKIIRCGDVEIPLYVIMPNHVHMIVIIHDCRDALNASALDTPALNKPALDTRALNASALDTPAINADSDAYRETDARGKTDTRGETDARGASLQRFGPQSGNLGAVVRGIKSAVTRFARENGIPFAWQPRYYDHIVRNQNDMNRIAEYIEQNPAKWETDCFY
jgi:REP element-mobilizing transposase RayT